MTGIVLAGGSSSRMGADKGLLKLEANTWVQTAVDKLSTLPIPVKVSVNRQQLEGYREVFTESDLIVDSAEIPVKGPLLGLLTAHSRYPSDDLFILACDMPLMEPGILKELLRHSEQSDADAFLFSNDLEPEPLCGIYTSRGLAGILNMAHRAELTKFSMKFMLEHLNTFSIPLADEQKKFFRNFNAHAELNGL